MLAHPELMDMPKNNTTKELLIEAAIEAWENINPEVLENLVKSMIARLEAVILADGWYTKY